MNDNGRAAKLTLSVRNGGQDWHPSRWHSELERWHTEARIRSMIGVGVTSLGGQPPPSGPTKTIRCIPSVPELREVGVYVWSQERPTVPPWTQADIRSEAHTRAPDRVSATTPMWRCRSVARDTWTSP